MSPALDAREWRRLEWSRSDGTNPFITSDGVLTLDGARVSGADELRAIVALANESLRRLGEPCFTRGAVAGLRHEALTARQLWAHYEKAGVTADAPPGMREQMEKQVAWQTALADLIESILPPPQE